VLSEARRGTLPGQVRTEATFADAAAEWLRFVEHDRHRKPSTLEGYRAIVGTHLLPAFGSAPLDSITPRMIEEWLEGLDRSANTRRLALVLLHGIFRRAMKVWSLRVNPAAMVEKPPVPRTGEIEVCSPEEVWALVRAAASEQDRVVFLTAAFTGLRRGELLALRWRDVDFEGSVSRNRRSTDHPMEVWKCGSVEVCDLQAFVPKRPRTRQGVLAVERCGAREPRQSPAVTGIGGVGTLGTLVQHCECVECDAGRWGCCVNAGEGQACRGCRGPWRARVPHGR
jgi:integrase